MSCEQRPSLFTRLAAQANAISSLSNKRGFYAGLALGSGGLLGTGLMLLARRLSRAGKRQVGPAGAAAPIRKLPALSPRPRVQAQTGPGQGKRCARCGTGGAAKKGGWYRIGNRSYCQDCAPAAARQAGVDLAAAPRTSAWTVNGTTAAPAQRTPTLRRPAGYLSPDKRVPIELLPARVRLDVGQRPDGQPARYVVEQGYVVMRPDGQDTGLAITPAVQIGPLREDGTQAVTEDTSQWLITHIPSGKSLGNRAFSDLENARQLACILAQLDWTRAEHQISSREVSQVNQTFHYYSQALRQEQQRRETPGNGTPIRGISPDGGTSKNKGDLTGQLIADNVGGLARVLEDSGARLFVVDSYGQRYDISRSEVRPPQENDFRLARIAQPLDPARHKDKRCRQCDASATAFIGQEQPWYRLDYQDFCPTCAAEFADREGYELPATIGALVG